MDMQMIRVRTERWWAVHLVAALLEVAVVVAASRLEDGGLLGAATADHLTTAGWALLSGTAVAAGWEWLAAGAARGAVPWAVRHFYNRPRRALTLVLLTSLTGAALLAVVVVVLPLLALLLEKVLFVVFTVLLFALFCWPLLLVVALLKGIGGDSSGTTTSSTPGPWRDPHPGYYRDSAGRLQSRAK